MSLQLFDVPDDILLCIHYCLTISDYVKLELVSKQWKQFLDSNPQLFNKFFTFRQSKYEGMVRKAKDQLRALRISIRNDWKPSFSTLLFVNGLQHLQVLSLKIRGKQLDFQFPI